MLRKKNNKSRHLANSDSELMQQERTNGKLQIQMTESAEEKGREPRGRGQRGPHDLRDRIKFMNFIPRIDQELGCNSRRFSTHKDLRNRLK